MKISLLHISSLVITYLGFGFLGYRFSRTFKRPVPIVTWMILSLTAVLALYLMPYAILVGVFDFKILVSSALHALAIGVLIGLVAREIRSKKETKTST